MQQKLTMNVGEVAQALGISKPTAYELCRSQGFPSLKVGRRIVVPIESFDRWLIRTSEQKTE